MLQMAIEKKFPGITIHWKLFGNPEFTGQIQRRKFYGTDVLLNDIPPRQKKYERQADYVRVICADRNIMNCIFKFAKDHPPPGFVLLISADGDFCQSMQAIKKMGFTTVLSYDDVKTLSNALKNIVDCRYYLSGIISTGGFDKGPSKGSDFCLKREVEYFHPTSCKTVVFWDMDSIPIPAYMFQLVANRKVERFLAEREPTFRMFGTVTYNIYGFEWNLPDLKHRSGRGVTYKTTTVSKDSLLENVMIADIWTTVIDSLPQVILLSTLHVRSLHRQLAVLDLKVAE